MIRRAFLALTALSLAACGQPAEDAQESAEPVAAISQPGANVSIGPGGAGGVTGQVTMSLDAVRAAAPFYSVAQVQDQVEGQPFTAITLSTNGEEVFRLLPLDDDRLHAIVTVSPRARGPNAEVVGVTTFAMAQPEQVAYCGAEFVEGSAGFACSTAEDGNFWLVYKLPEEYDGPSDPFGEIDPDVLHDATLAEMRWIAPRG